MIPPLEENGYLPPGVHAATLDEIEDRFGKETELRRAQMQSLRWLVAIALRAGVQKIVVNGSFATDILEPNDLDCVLLLSADYPKEKSAKFELDEGLPFIQMYLEGETGYNYFTQEFYAIDRDDVPKGVLEVTLG
jgi:hypothetical protein